MSLRNSTLSGVRRPKGPTVSSTCICWLKRRRTYLRPNVPIIMRHIGCNALNLELVCVFHIYYRKKLRWRGILSVPRIYQTYRVTRNLNNGWYTKYPKTYWWHLNRSRLCSGFPRGSSQLLTYNGSNDPQLQSSSMEVKSSDQTLAS